MSPSPPILVLDSGLGGLSVVRALRSVLPHEDIVYFGDTGRGPYGGKSPASVVGFARQMIAHALELNPKHVVLACNTTSAVAWPQLKRDFPNLSISGIVEPGARAAIEAAGAKAIPIIAILATEATLLSKAYEKAIHRRRHHARLLLRATPLLVALLDEGRDLRDSLVKVALRQYLDPVKQRGPDVLVLGCTHTLLFKPAIVHAMGPTVSVIDSAEACAQDVARRLQAAGQLRGDGSPGELKCMVTDLWPRLRGLAARILGHEIELPMFISPEELEVHARDARVQRAPLRLPA